MRNIHLFIRKTLLSVGLVGGIAQAILLGLRGFDLGDVPDYTLTQLLLPAIVIGGLLALYILTGFFYLVYNLVLQTEYRSNIEEAQWEKTNITLPASMRAADEKIIKNEKLLLETKRKLREVF
jgi:hypothetical protein